MTLEEFKELMPGDVIQYGSGKYITNITVHQQAEPYHDTARVLAVSTENHLSYWYWVPDMWKLISNKERFEWVG